MSEPQVRVLVVDDDETMRLICQRFLAQCKDVGKLVIEEAASGEEAIVMLRERAFDCILSDYRMGAVNGIEVLAFAMKERPKAVRILFTGFAAPAIHKEALVRARVHEFLEKPMTTPELETLLSTKMVDPFLKPMAKRARSEAEPA